VQMILSEKAEALREEADSLSTVPADNSHWTTYCYLSVCDWNICICNSI